VASDGSGKKCATKYRRETNLRRKDRSVNVVLWIATGLLAAVALVGGATKAFVPKEKLAAHSGGEWVAAADDSFVKSLGVLELLAAIGLILPAVLDIARVMVPVTALCWVLLMIGAMITHGRLGQTKFVLVNVVYLAIAVFIAYGRFGPSPYV
jgi:hypothetical protein